MSIKLIQLVWNTELILTPSEKLILFCLANFANDKNDLLCCPSYKTLAQKTSMTRRHVIKIIDQLCQQNILIKVSKQEDSYQSNQYYFNQKTLGCGVLGTPGVVSSEHHPSVLGTPNNIRDNIYNINIYSEDAKEIINFLRKITGRNYQPNPPTIKLIAQRLKEGVTPLQCRKVILKKFDEWGHDKVMEKYLRPSTLFNKTNLHMKYLPELVTDERKEAIKQGVDKLE